MNRKYSDQKFKKHYEQKSNYPLAKLFFFFFFTVSKKKDKKFQKWEKNSWAEPRNWFFLQNVFHPKPENYF